MDYPSVVYNILTSLVWSITPALPTGAVGTRPAVGVPETIPDVTFITRALNATDGFPEAQRLHLNGFNAQARQFHVTYGLAPITVNSFEDILNHFERVNSQLGRMRFISHGNDEFLFCPIFNNGQWSFGMHKEYLQALQNSDDAGLRYIIHAPDALHSPILINGVDLILDGMRSFNGPVLAPLGLEPPGSPLTGELREYVELVNDYYQVRHGSIGVGETTFAVMTPAQETSINTSLDRIETAVRLRVLGVGGTTITGPQLDAFKTAVMGATPIQLEFLGRPFAFSPTVITDVTTALAATPQVEADIRTAIVGAPNSPLFLDYLGNIILGLQVFHPNVLILGGDAHDEARIRSNADLEAFALTCVDLHFIRNVPLLIGPTAITATQKTTIRNALLTISNTIRGRITAATPITAAQLNTLRDTIDTLPLRKSGITGGTLTIPPNRFRELTAATTAMQNNFRTKLDHFRSLMKPNDASIIDIRGCLVAKTISFLDPTLRDFLGAANKPTISAPEWFQSFPQGLATQSSTSTTDTNIFQAIDDLVAGGRPANNISPANVLDSLTLWTGMIDFDPHFDFIVALFAAAASKLDFATLAWREWNVGAVVNGIPVLRMEAGRIDDLVSLNLGALIDRFRIIFEIPVASTPNAAARTRLNTLQPHLVTFKTRNDAVAAGPPPADLPQLFTDLTTLAGNITGIGGFPAPAAPLAPASDSLADIQTSVANIKTHLETILNAELNVFFTAIQGRTADVNARIRYYYNVGLPLLLQSSANPVSFLISVFMGAVNSTTFNRLRDGALRSWMRIQWTGTAAQAATMNGRITALDLSVSTNRDKASQVSMLSEDDPDVAGTPAGVAPTQLFRDHIKTKP